MHLSTALVHKCHNAVSAKSECQCNFFFFKTHCWEMCYSTPSGNINRVHQENTKLPTDPVYLDIDQSLVKRKQSTQWSKMLFSADVHPKIKLHKNGWSYDASYKRRTSEQRCSAIFFWRNCTIHHQPIHPNTYLDSFSDGSQT